jgi:hypothetical protein
MNRLSRPVAFIHRRDSPSIGMIRPSEFARVIDRWELSVSADDDGVAQ